MENSRLHVAVWILLPIIGLIVLMVMTGFRRGIFIIPPVIALVGLIVPFAWALNQRKI